MRVARVHKILLDEDDRHLYEELGKSDSIGTILFSYINEEDPVDGNLSDLLAARPIHFNISHYPVEKELVFVVRAPHQKHNTTGADKFYYYQSIKIFHHH